MADHHCTGCLGFDHYAQRQYLSLGNRRMFILVLHRGIDLLAVQVGSQNRADGLD